MWRCGKNSPPERKFISSLEMSGVEPLSYKKSIIPASHTFISISTEKILILVNVSL